MSGSRIFVLFFGGTDNGVGFGLSSSFLFSFLFS